jgi:hypothetical protein
VVATRPPPLLTGFNPKKEKPKTHTQNRRVGHPAKFGAKEDAGLKARRYDVNGSGAQVPGAFWRRLRGYFTVKGRGDSLGGV